MEVDAPLGKAGDGAIPLSFDHAESRRTAARQLQLLHDGRANHQARGLQRRVGAGKIAHAVFASFSNAAGSFMPTPGPAGTLIKPFFTVIGGSNHLPYCSIPSLYS